MQRELPESFTSNMAPRNRSVSMSGDFQRPVSSQAMRSPPRVNPEPQFIAASAASQIVTADQGLNALDSPSGTGGALVAPGSLSVLNGFLDNLLFNILLTARSTKLTAIKPALSDVLKPRLAKEVVSAADEELSEYISGGDEEELSEFRGGLEPAGRFELDRSWKLTRLRCMVYTRLGDMEEEDEEEHLRREGLDEDSIGPGRFSSHVGHITPAAAIFLTSILEYIGEHALIIAGEAAAARLNSKLYGNMADDQFDESPEKTERLVVEETDMEKIALNSTLGRLWRTWRKNVRSSILSRTLSRTLSRESLLRRGHGTLRSNSRQSSIGTIDDISPREVLQESTVSEIDESVDPVEVPLPADNYEEDTEAPAFTTQLAVAMPARSVRPRSLVVSNVEIASPRPSAPRSAPPAERDFRTHTRSASLPNSPYGPSVRHRISPETRSLTGSPGEQLETMHEREEPHELFRQRKAQEPEIPERSRQRQRASTVGHRVEKEQPENSDSGSRSRSGQVAISSDYRNGIEPATPHKSSRRVKEENYDGSQRMSSSSQSSRHKATANGQSRVYGEDNSDNRAHRSSRRQESPKMVEGPFVSDSNMSTPQHTRSTPLRDMVSAVRGTSPSSTYPNQSPNVSDVPSVSDASERYHVSRSNSRKTTKSSVSESATSRNAQPTPTSTAGAERAAVQRVTSPPSTPREQAYQPQVFQPAKPRRSDSIGSSRDRRPITSGSATSGVSNKLRGLVGRQASDNSQVPLPVRNSTDTNGAQSRFGDSVADPSNLDTLIQSDETIHYTLTPRNMREMEDPNSPRWRPSRNGAGPPDENMQDMPEDDANGLKIYTPSMAASTNSKSPKPSISKPDPNRKASVPEARDARIASASVRDFADFIKSTGPPEAPRRQSGPVSRGHSMVNGSSGAASSHRVTASGPISPTSVYSKARTVAPPGSSRSQNPRPRMQARPAAARNDARTAELIDFLREGPPEESPQPGGSNIGVDRSAFARSPATENSSATSRAAPRAGGVQASNPTGHGFDGPMPARKQRRVKDPYAIDTDSDDDLEELLQRRSQKVHKEEESLVDFLRNCPPPPPSDPPQLLSVNMKSAASGSKPRSKSTASSVKSRLLRTPSADKRPSTKVSRSSLRSYKSNATAPNVTSPNAPSLPRLQSASSAFGRTNSQIENYVANQTSYASQVERARNGAPKAHPRPPMDDLRGRDTGTSSLADFLKNTGPPEPPPRVHSSASSFNEKDRSSPSSFSRMFLRKKKQPV